MKNGGLAIGDRFYRDREFCVGRATSRHQEFFSFG